MVILRMPEKFQLGGGDEVLILSELRLIFGGSFEYVCNEPANPNIVPELAVKDTNNNDEDDDDDVQLIDDVIKLLHEQ